MIITYNDLRDKEVVSVRDGRRLGFVCDIQLETCSGKILAIVLPSGSGYFSVFSRKECLCIPWEQIERIGDDIILVRHCEQLEFHDKHK